MSDGLIIAYNGNSVFVFNKSTWFFVLARLLILIQFQQSIVFNYKYDKLWHSKQLKTLSLKWLKFPNPWWEVPVLDFQPSLSSIFEIPALCQGLCCCSTMNDCANTLHCYYSNRIKTFEFTFQILFVSQLESTQLLLQFFCTLQSDSW